MKQKKSIKFFVICFVIACVIVVCVANWECIMKSIGKDIVDFAASKEALPSFGEYVCSDLELCLIFNEHGLYASSSDYKTKVYADFHGRLLWGDGVIAFYYWDQINNVVEISFGQPPSGASKDITYLFVPCSTDRP